MQVIDDYVVPDYKKILKVSRKVKRLLKRSKGAVFFSLHLNKPKRRKNG